MEKLAQAEAAAGGSRSDRLCAARDVFYRGELAERIAAFCATATSRDATGSTHPALLAYEDLAAYHAQVEEPVTFHYRGLDVAGCPPPTGGGIHLIQILNMLEGHDVAGLGFGTVDGIHLLAEALKIAFADRAAATGDPAFVEVPVARLIAKDYARDRRAEIDMAKAGTPVAAVAAGSPNTTHVTTADAEGNVVAATQTINMSTAATSPASIR